MPYNLIDARRRPLYREEYEVRALLLDATYYPWQHVIAYPLERGWYDPDTMEYHDDWVPVDRHKDWLDPDLYCTLAWGRNYA